MLFYNFITTSTQDDIKALHLLHPSHVILWQHSNNQLLGRGQRSKVWVSPPGNLYLSGFIKNCSLLPGQTAITVGFAIANMLQSLNLNNAEISLKWPNDILINNKKCGGILIENNNGYFIGIGLNISTHPPHTETPATHLNIYGDFTLWQISLLVQKHIENALLNPIPFSQIQNLWWQIAQKSTAHWVTQQPVNGQIIGLGHQGQLLIKQENGEIFERHNPL